MIFDHTDPFHACAFCAYVDEARKCNGEPEPEKVKQTAYKYYEKVLHGINNNI